MNRILYCETNRDGTVGGSYFSLFFLVTRLDRKKYTPIVLFRYMNPVAARLQSRGIDVRIMDSGRTISGVGLLRKLKITAVINFIAAVLLPAFRNRAFLRENAISMVHLNNGLDANYPWILAAKWAKIPCVIHQRGEIEDQGPLFRYFRGCVEKVVCVSKAVAHDAVTKGVPSSKVITIYNGIDSEVEPAENREEIRARLGIQDSSPLIGIAGTIRSWKGQDVVVRAVKVLKERFPDLICLIIGGVSKDQLQYEEYLHNLVDELAVSNHIRFLGHQDQVLDFINAIDVPIHASTEPEPFGRVIIEAMALGKPIVASRAGGVTEIIVEGETGLMYTPGNADELAACVRQLLEDPARARAMGVNGKRRVKAQFHADETAKQVMALYEGTLSAAKGIPASS